MRDCPGTIWVSTKSEIAKTSERTDLVDVVVKECLSSKRGSCLSLEFVMVSTRYAMLNSTRVPTFWPTLERFAINGISHSCRVSLGPTPDAMRSRGDWKTPADKMTSLRAEKT